MSKLKTLTISIAMLVACSIVGPANSEQWPQKPVKIIVPYAAGGGSDTMARLFAQRFSAAWGKPFYVENVAGASGILAAEQVAHARPDGYTLFMAVTPQIAIAPAMFKVKYDPVKDFVPISAVITNTFALVVNQKVPAKTVSEFVDYIRSQAAQLPYSTSGIGSVTHLAMELFLNRTKLKMTNVNYRGAAPALAAVIAGEVPAMFSVLSESLPHAAAQTIRLLAVSSEERIPQAPDVPTLIELGFSGYIVKSWNGLMAPEGTPQKIVDQLANEVAQAMKDQEFVARLKAFGAEPLGNTPDEFRLMISKDIALWGKALKAARVSLH